MISERKNVIFTLGVVMMVFFCHPLFAEEISLDIDSVIEKALSNNLSLKILQNDFLLCPSHTRITTQKCG